MELLIGILGMLLILIAFFLEEFAHHSRHESIAFNLINIVGAGLLGIYAWMLNSWPFIILNAVWVGIAVVKLVLIARKRT